MRRLGIMIVCLCIGVVQAQATPPSPLSPDQQAEGLALTLASELFVLAESELMSGLVPAEAPLRLLATYDVPRRLAARMRVQPYVRWWALGSFDEATWLFSARRAEAELTSETLLSALMATEEDASLPIISRMLWQDQPDVAEEPEPLILALEEADFAGGQGWRRLSVYLDVDRAYGDGLYCGGTEMRVVPVFYYDFMGLLAEPGIFINAIVPFRLSSAAQLPELYGLLNTCVDPDDPDNPSASTTTIEPAEGWTQDEYGRLIPLPETFLAYRMALVEALIQGAEQGELAEVLSALDATLATLSLEAGWLAQALPPR